MELEVTSVGAHLRSISDGDSPFVIEFHQVAVRGEPTAHEHDEIRWFGADELGEVPMAPADRLFADGLTGAWDGPTRPDGT